MSVVVLHLVAALLNVSLLLLCVSVVVRLSVQQEMFT